MLPPRVLAMRRKSMCKMAISDMPLEARIASIYLLVAHEDANPTHHMIEEKTVPLVQGIGDQEVTRVRKFPIPPKGLKYSVELFSFRQCCISSEVGGTKTLRFE